MTRRFVYRRSSSEDLRSNTSQKDSQPRSGSKLVFRRNQAKENKPICDIAKECGSCRFINFNYEMNLQKKHKHGLQILELAGVLERARIRPPVVSPRQRDYRALAKLAVRAYHSKRRVAQSQDSRREQRELRGQTETSDEKRFSIGLFKPGTHEVVELNRCPLHTQSIRRAIYDLQKLLDASAINPWEEKTGEGDLRYLSIRATSHTQELMITFVTTSLEKKADFRKIIDELRELGHRIVSAHVNVNTETGNAIFGSQTKRIAGHDRLRERLADLDFEISPTAFFQINPWQAERLYRRVEQLSGTPVFDAKAVDLYCGGGPISMLLARNGYEVLGVEENPFAIEDARRNARRNGLEHKLKFHTARVEDAEDVVADWMKNANLFVVNPSRKGLAKEARDYIAKTLKGHSAPLIYVSCNVNSLARDLKVLQEQGDYRLRQLEAFDMFPQTDKMEWIAVLTAKFNG